MTAVVTHPTRTEVEVSADTAWAIIEGLIDDGFLRRNELPGIVACVSASVPIAVSHLRDAMARRETHRYVPPVPQRRAIPGAPPSSNARPPDPPREYAATRNADRKARREEQATTLRTAVRVAAASTDLRLNEDKTAFVHVCKSCGREIKPGEPVRHVACPGGPTSADPIGEAHGEPGEPIAPSRPTQSVS
ncbi:MAG TPA: hypothetical protein VF244_10965 [Acidimicrobiales bacterium]